MAARARKPGRPKTAVRRVHKYKCALYHNCKTMVVFEGYGVPPEYCPPCAKRARAIHFGGPIKST